MIGRLLGGPGSPLGSLRRALADPARSQRELLARIVARAAATEWGREHGCDRILRHPDLVAEYQRRVPPTDPAGLSPFIDRLRDGERDVLWPGRIRRFAVPGGTQSGERVIPLSREALRSMARAAATPAWNHLATRAGAVSLLGGRWLALPGEIVSSDRASGVMTGSVSAFLALAARPFTAPWILSVPQDELHRDDWDRKLDRLAERSFRADVRALIMLPSWAPALFDRVLARAGIVRGPGAMRRVWPNLRVFFTGGVALAPHRPMLDWSLGPGVDYVESYSASEGFLAFQDDVASSDLLLHPASGLFYEFVPLESGGAELPRHTVATIEAGVPYAVHVTDAGALWSLALGDVVRFTSVRPPRLRIMGRTRELLDRHGERLRAEHAHAAVTALEQFSGIPCRHAHVTYDVGEPTATPRHHWIVEFEHAPADALAVADRIDSAVVEANGGYRVRRAAAALDRPRVTIVPRGTFDRYLRHARRRFGAQSKHLALSDDDAIARDLVAGAPDQG
jgi:hypothetical protein